MAAPDAAPADGPPQHRPKTPSKKAKRSAIRAENGATDATNSGDGGVPGAWGQVDVKDDFLMGLEEGGFMGLEVLAEPRMEATAGGTSLMPSAGTEAKQATTIKVGSNDGSKLVSLAYFRPCSRMICAAAAH